MITTFKKMIMMIISNDLSISTPDSLISFSELRFTADGGEQTFEINGDNWTIT